MRRLGSGLAWLIGAIITAPAGAGSVAWQRAVYYDASYPWTWAGSAPLWVRDVLAADGYDVVDAAGLRTWMDDRISDGLPAVVVFSQDVAPDTVLEEQSSQCTLRRYLDAGGKIVWFGDVPLYYQGHAGGGLTVWGVDGSINVLGFNAAGGAWDGAQDVSFTPDGTAWGLTDTWPSERPALPAGLRVLAEDAEGNAAAWVRHYVAEPDDLPARVEVPPQRALRRLLLQHRVGGDVLAEDHDGGQAVADAVVHPRPEPRRVDDVVAVGGQDVTDPEGRRSGPRPRIARVVVDGALPGDRVRPSRRRYDRSDQPRQP
ncbi:MAG: hypothetical protein ACYSUR_15855 [Planctomycetota bacterium]